MNNNLTLSLALLNRDRLFMEWAEDLAAVINNAQGSTFTALLRRGVSGEPIYVGGSLARWAEYFELQGQVLGRSHYDFFPDLPEEWKEEHRRVFERGEFFQRSGVWFRDKCFSYSIGPLPRRNGYHGMVFWVTDETELRRRALIDPLTGVWSRFRFEEDLERLLPLCYSLLFIDLDRFKVVNDTYGHTVGDVVLKAAASRIVKTVSIHSSEGSVARWGGDEFAVLLPPSADTAAIATSIIAEIEQPIATGLDEDAFISASVGIAKDCEGVTPAQAVVQADRAMYLAKARDRGGKPVSRAVHLTQTQADDLEQDIRLAGDLPGAFMSNQFRLVYHPIWDLKGGGTLLCGFEALIRWHHPEYGLLYPDRFLPVAERRGQMEAITEWVVGEAVKQQQQWRKELGQSASISINVPPRQIETGHIERVFCKIGRLYGGLEVLETALLQPSVGLNKLLGLMKSLGMELWLDDFGAENSRANLYSLSAFAPHLAGIKIDRQQTMMACAEPEILQAVIQLARACTLKGRPRLRVTCEGVDFLDDGTDMLPIVAAAECKAQGFHPKLGGKPRDAIAAGELILGQRGC